MRILVLGLCVVLTLFGIFLTPVFFHVIRGFAGHERHLTNSGGNHA